MVEPPRIVVAVLNHNGSRWLHKCLSSAIASDYPHLEICLVDNASTDGSLEYVQQHFPQVKVIRHSMNLGFAEGYNRALEKVEADYLVLLNNDTQVLNPSWIKYLLDTAKRDPRIAAVACKMVSMDDHSCLQSVGEMGIPFWRGFLDIGSGEHDRGQYDSQLEPFGFCGGAALIKRDAFAKIAGFDEEYFMYVEDVDLSWRLRLLGYRVGYAHEALVAHYAGGPSEHKIASARKLYYCQRNLLRAILKNCGSSIRWALRNYFLFSLIAAVGFSILEPRKALAIARAILWNLLSFRNTYSQRLAIQSSRKSGETEILASMYPRIERYQPSEHPALRRILNILFEYNQSIPDQLN